MIDHERSFFPTSFKRFKYMRKYFAYIRVSTARQGEHGVSLQEQRGAITRYCQTNSIDVCEWFEERVTAAKSGRPVFGDMLRRLRQGRAEGVVIHKIDRGARNLKDWANLGELLDQGIDVRFANESLDMASRGGRLSADIQAVVAADYIRNLREETRKGFYGRIKQGFYPLAAPLGYADQGGGTAKSICPLKGPLVRRAFELYATGRYGLDILVETLYSQGLRNRRGGIVSRNGLSTVLNNPFYIGLIRLRKTGETFPGKHPPLIAPTLFDQVQDVLNGKTPKRVKRHDVVFRQILSCKVCARGLIGESQKSHIYYRCHSKTCRLTCVREETVSDAIALALRPLQFTPDEQTVLLAAAADIRGDRKNETERHSASLRMRRTAIIDRLNRLTDAFLDSVIEKRVFEECKEALHMERLSIEEKIRKLESRETVADGLENWLELAGSAYLSYKSANDWEKRDLIKAVCSNRIVDRKNVEIKLFPAFEVLAQRPKYTSGSLDRASYRVRIRAFLTKLVTLIPGKVLGTSPTSECTTNDISGKESNTCRQRQLPPPSRPTADGDTLE